MHEIAIARSIVEIVEEHARREGCARVRAVRLAIGALSHVDPRALEFGFEAVAGDGPARGARLIVERPPGEGWCTSCNAKVAVAALGDACPLCGGYQWLVAGGQDLRVVELEVE